MQQARQSVLAELVCAAYRGAGLPLLPTGRKVKPLAWPRPPLYTELTLAGEPLQPYIEIAVKGGIDELVDVYEQFIAGYLVTNKFHHIEPARWLGTELGMRMNDARMLFSPALGMRAKQRYHYLMCLVQYAALVSYNFHDTLRIDNPDSFVVTDGRSDFRFGVKHGLPVSNLAYGYPIGVRANLPVLIDKPLSHTTRSLAKRRRALMIHDKLFYWAETQPEKEALQMALGILWWRSPTSTATLNRMFKKERERPPIGPAVESARAMLDSTNPLEELRELFVPAHMPIGEFIKRFSSPYQPLKLPLTQEMRQKFENSLDQLQ